MNLLLFYLAYSILWLITLLPLRLLYPVSDLLFFLLFYVVRYRRTTVYRNLERSFPDKSPHELRKIMRRSYRQLTDYFLEWIYRIHMSSKELSRRMVYKNPDIIKKYLHQDRDIILYLSHHGNWEWLTLLPFISGYTTLAVYKPLQNKYFDRLFLRLRGKFGVVGVPMASTLRTILEYRDKKIPFMLFSLADQRPEWKSLQHWTRFMNQNSPVITGSEKISRRFNMVAIHLSYRKIKRGYYEAEFHVLSEDPAREEDFGITRLYLGQLEDDIRKSPELYLWTHKRWKYRRQEAKNPQDIGPPIPPPGNEP